MCQQSRGWSALTALLGAAYHACPRHDPQQGWVHRPDKDDDAMPGRIKFIGQLVNLWLVCAVLEHRHGLICRAAPSHHYHQLRAVLLKLTGEAVERLVMSLQPCGCA